MYRINFTSSMTSPWPTPPQLPREMVLSPAFGTHSDAKTPRSGPDDGASATAPTRNRTFVEKHPPSAASRYRQRAWCRHLTFFARVFGKLCAMGSLPTLSLSPGREGRQVRACAISPARVRNSWPQQAPSSIRSMSMSHAHVNSMSHAHVCLARAGCLKRSGEADSYLRDGDGYSYRVEPQSEPAYEYSYSDLRPKPQGLVNQPVTLAQTAIYPCDGDLPPCGSLSPPPALVAQRPACLSR